MCVEEEDEKYDETFQGVFIENRKQKICHKHPQKNAVEEKGFCTPKTQISKGKTSFGAKRLCLLPEYLFCLQPKTIFPLKPKIGTSVWSPNYLHS
jgi:hypothetical protein